MYGSAPGHDDAVAPERDLRDDIGALGVLRAHRRNLLVQWQFLGDRLERGEADGQARFAAQFAHPFELVPFALQVRRHFEHAISDPAHCPSDAEKLFLGRGRAGHEHAVDRFVEDRARGRKAESPCAQAFLDDPGHLRDIGFGRRLVRRAAFAHHIGADGAVRDVCSHIDRARQFLERIEIFGKSLPVPGHALGQRRSGDILDAFHQADQPVMPVGLGRREADAAIAHHDRGDAVPA